MFVCHVQTLLQNENREQKLSDIAQSIAADVRSRCFCDFRAENIINDSFNCGNLTEQVVYNAAISFTTISTSNFGASNLVALVSDWNRRSSSLQVSGSTLTTDPDCQTLSNSLNSMDCLQPPQSDFVFSRNAIIGVVIGGVVLLVIIAAIAAFVIYILMRQRVSAKVPIK